MWITSNKKIWLNFRFYIQRVDAFADMGAKQNLHKLMGRQVTGVCLCAHCTWAGLKTCEPPTQVGNWKTFPEILLYGTWCYITQVITTFMFPKHGNIKLIDIQVVFIQWGNLTHLVFVFVGQFTICFSQPSTCPTSAEGEIPNDKVLIVQKNKLSSI